MPFNVLKESTGMFLCFVSYFIDVHHYICSKFHFVDLAGSERAHRTKNFGDRFKGKMFSIIIAGRNRN